MNALTQTQLTILKASAGRSKEGIIFPLPPHIRGGAAKKVIDSLRSKGLLDGEGDQTVISAEGFRAIGLEPPTKVEDFEEDVSTAEQALAETKPRRTRENTKQALVINLLKRPEGATADQIAEATGWQLHTIRGFISIARKKLGLEITTQRSRVVGPNQQGSPGSYSTYRILQKAG